MKEKNLSCSLGELIIHFFVVLSPITSLKKNRSQRQDQIKKPKLFQK